MVQDALILPPEPANDLAGVAKIIDVTVAADAPATGETIQALSEKGLLQEDLLIVAIERGDETLMPNGETTIREGDLLTVLSREGQADELLELFSGASDHTHSDPPEA